MNLQTWLGFLLAAVFSSAAIYATAMASAKRSGAPAPEEPIVKVWPIPAIPIRAMAMMLLFLCAFGGVTMALGGPQPADDSHPQYVVLNTYIGFSVLGAACLIRRSWRLQKTLAAFVGIWAACGLTDSLLPWGFGEMIMDQDGVSTDHGRMAPFVAMGMVLASVGAWLVHESGRSLVRRYVIGGIGALLALYGFFAILGYTAGSHAMLAYDGWREVPVGAALMLTLVGVGFSSKIYHKPNDRWTHRELRLTINSLISITAISAFTNLVFAFMNTEAGPYRVLLAVSLLLAETGSLGLITIRAILVEKSSCANPGCPLFISYNSQAEDSPS